MYEAQAEHDAYLGSVGYQYTAAFFTQDAAVGSAYDGLCTLCGFSPGYIPSNFLMDRDGCARWGMNTISDITDYRNRISELLGEGFE